MTCCCCLDGSGGGGGHITSWSRSLTERAEVMGAFEEKLKFHLGVMEKK